ncbi:hypothetical protein VTO42DRAFT_3479 [Malbranchea cinnamomea]
MAKGAPQQLPKAKKEPSTHQESASQESDVNNVLRLEQLLSVYQQQGMMIGQLHNRQGPIQWSPLQTDHHLAARPASNNTDAGSYRSDSTSLTQAGLDQLDAILKPFMLLARPSDDHPIQRHLAPGALQDPTFFSKQALAKLGTPYADGSSNENRKKIAELNHRDAMKTRSNQSKNSNL